VHRGGATNNSKSHIYNWNISRQKEKKIKEIMGFEAVRYWKDFNYSEVPIFLRRAPRNAWKKCRIK